MPIRKRRAELRKIGLSQAVRQIASTIRALRKGQIDLPGQAIDWTIMPIVPIIVTEEVLPKAPYCWDKLYRGLERPLKALSNVAPVASLRLLSVDDVEMLPDIRGLDDFGTICLKWANHPALFECPLNWYLQSSGIDFRKRFMLDRAAEVFTFLAERLGLDVRKLTFGRDRKKA
jgi:hypothetical protein